MEYICKDCGNIFDYGEEKIVKEPHGEKNSCCPLCGGAFEEAERCSVCKGAFSGSSLISGVCLECIEESKMDFNFCKRISQKLPKEPILLSPVFLSLFDAGDIEQVLTEYIEKNIPDIKCDNFANDDLSWFAEMIEKEVRK